MYFIYSNIKLFISLIIESFLTELINFRINIFDFINSIDIFDFKIEIKINITIIIPIDMMIISIINSIFQT